MLYSNIHDETKKIKSQKHVRRVDIQHDSEIVLLQQTVHKFLMNE